MLALLNVRSHDAMVHSTASVEFRLPGKRLIFRVSGPDYYMYIFLAVTARCFQVGADTHIALPS